jgi:transcriptional regulator with XRE-family HTH domain
MIFFKEKFRAIRESHGLTLEDVARACGVSQSIVSRWEQKGKSQPRPARIKALAALFHCSPEEFADFEPGRRKSKRLTMEDVALRGAAVQVDLSPEKAVEAFRQGLLREFILSDLDPVVKDKVLQTIAGFRKKSEE